MAAPKGNKYAVGNKGGGPTKYQADYPQKVEQYIKSCKTKKELPTIAGLSLYLHCSKPVIEVWKHKYQEFLYSLMSLLSAQEQKLINKGLKGEYNSVIAKLILSSNHGYAEKKDLAISGLSIADIAAQMGKKGK